MRTDADQTFTCDFTSYYTRADIRERFTGNPLLVKAPVWKLKCSDLVIKGSNQYIGHIENTYMYFRKWTTYYRHWTITSRILRETVEHAQFLRYILWLYCYATVHIRILIRVRCIYNKPNVKVSHERVTVVMDELAVDGLWYSNLVSRILHVFEIEVIYWTMSLCIIVIIKSNIIYLKILDAWY